jgi:hypothetical protein
MVYLAGLRILCDFGLTALWWKLAGIEVSLIQVCTITYSSLSSFKFQAKV